MPPFDVRKIFEECKIEGWTFHDLFPVGESGQAMVALVRRESDSKIGVFRFLKHPTEIDIKRFQREVSILTNPKYQNKNIVNILACSSEDPYWYISEKGDNFETYWNDILDKTADPNKVTDLAIDIILKLLEGLSPLHDENVVHRDIKPKNLIVLNGEPVLIDFGLVFSEEEERITPESRPVGNRYFSPDPMMYRTEEVPAWFDVFMLSQVLIWMVIERSPKGWFRPLDWRFIKFQNGMSDDYKISLRALTARCSDPSEIKNAREMKDLMKSLFSSPHSESKINPKVAEIHGSIKRGKAKSLLVTATDFGNFENKFPLFEKFLLEIYSDLKNLEKTYQDNSLPVVLSQIQNMEKWIDQIKNTTRFSKNEQIQLCNLRCGKTSGKDLGYFGMNFNIHFFAGEHIPANPLTFLREGNPLPENFLPFALRFNTNSSKPEYRKIYKSEMFYIAMDKTGSLYKFDQHFKNQILISREELYTIVEGWLDDPKAWELIQ